MPDSSTVKKQLTGSFAPENPKELLGVEQQAEEFSSLQDETVKDRIQDRGERKTYAERYYRLASVWVCAIILILFLQGYGCIELEQNVLMMALGTTTANIIGVLVIVANYLFGRVK